jgi:hypothetical protein
MRSELRDYLASGGWRVRANGEGGLLASWPEARLEGREKVNLQFSLAVWQVMNPGVEASIAEPRRRAGRKRSAVANKRARKNQGDIGGS